MRSPHGPHDTHIMALWLPMGDRGRFRHQRLTAPQSPGPNNINQSLQFRTPRHITGLKPEGIGRYGYANSGRTLPIPPCLRHLASGIITVACGAISSQMPVANLDCMHTCTGGCCIRPFPPLNWIMK